MAAWATSLGGRWAGSSGDAVGGVAPAPHTRMTGGLGGTGRERERGGERDKRREGEMEGDR